MHYGGKRKCTVYRGITTLLDAADISRERFHAGNSDGHGPVYRDPVYHIITLIMILMSRLISILFDRSVLARGFEPSTLLVNSNVTQVVCN